MASQKKMSTTSIFFWFFESITLCTAELGAALIKLDRSFSANHSPSESHETDDEEIVSLGLDNEVTRTDSYLAAVTILPVH